MTADFFKGESEELLTKLEAMVSEMICEGNSEEESQKVCVQNAIGKLRMVIEGVENSDFKEEQIEKGNFRADLKECGCCYDIFEIMVDEEGEEYADFRDCCDDDAVEDTLADYVAEQDRVMGEN